MGISFSKTRIYISNSQAWGILASLLFLMSWLDKMAMMVPWVGDAAVVLMAVALGGSVILNILNRQRAPVSVFVIAGLVGLLIVVYVLSQIFNPIPGYKTIAQLFLVALCFIGAALLLSREPAITTLANLWIWLSIVNLALWVSAEFPYPFEGLFAHKNMLGSLTTFGLFFVVSARLMSRSKSWWNLGLIAGIVVVMASGSRGSWLAIVVTTVSYLFWPRIAVNRQIYTLAFLLIVLGVIGFIFIYIDLPERSNFSQLQSVVLRYTGQRINSGRQVYWPFLLEAIQQRPWGYGPGATLERLGFESVLSSHNLYIQVALQTGIPGLINVIAILWIIWTSFFKKPGDKVVRLAAAFLLGVLVHESFEVSLIQNNLTLGIVMWTIFGIGVGRLYLPHASELSEPPRNAHGNPSIVP